MKRIFAMKRFWALCEITMIAALATPAQEPAAKKPMTFTGKVEAVNEAAKG